LRQILINLVNNAIKFTEAGKIQVHLYCPSPYCWAIKVSDTGSGIPSEAQDHIFEPFRQVDGSITRKHGGAGLGLSIVKQLITLMEGQITLESELGRGSTFTVSFPLLLPQSENSHL
jgi:signal transduction histidine kinase